jgi:hypothetical protein
LDSDRRPVDHDTINQVANVSLLSSAVRGQRIEGLRHESFDIGGWNAQDGIVKANEYRPFSGSKLAARYDNS